MTCQRIYSFALIVAICSLVHAKEDTNLTCLADTKNPYPYYATRSSYKNIRDTSGYHAVPGCTPIKLWMLIRHASRYPSQSKIRALGPMMTDVRDRIINNYEKVPNGGMCAKDVDNLKNWSFNFTADMGNRITREGMNDLKTLAARLRSDFPDLLNLAYSSRQFQFKTSSEAQSVESAQLFVRYLFNLSRDDGRVPNISENLAFLHPQMVCSKWVEKVNSPEMTKEEALFVAGDIVHKMIADISNRLGFKYNLTYEVVKNMYGMCRYENVCFGQLKSPFCAAFSQEDLKIMEYTEDVHRYYQDGHGNYVDKKLGCPLVKDMINKFSDSENSTDSPVSIFFGHSGTVIQLITALNVKKDQYPLTHDTYENMTNRQWRMSFIAPFNANFLSVLYDCENGGKYIRFFLNEWPIVSPNCDKSTGLCSVDYVRKMFKNFIDPRTCNLDFCDAPKHVTSSSNNISGLVLKWIAIVLCVVIFLYLLIFRILQLKCIRNCRKNNQYTQLE